MPTFSDNSLPLSPQIEYLHRVPPLSPPLRLSTWWRGDCLMT